MLEDYVNSEEEEESAFVEHKAAAATSMATRS